jgi:hypothetical protein
MPAQRLNYVVIHKGQSQVYGSSSKEIALTTPLPPGVKLEDREVLFITYQPDNEVLSVHRVPKDEVVGADLKESVADRKARQAAEAESGVM